MNNSFFDHLNAKYKQSDLVTITIRVSSEEHAAIQDIADYMDCTQQEIIHELIVNYLIPTWKQLNKESDDELISDEKKDNTVQQTFFLLNTNKANDVNDHKMMIDNSVAAAFESGWKEQINRIKKNDVVFLYESGNGIVAYGKANGIIEMAHHYGRADETFFQRLNDFTILDKPITAKKIKSTLQRKVSFPRTLTKIKDGEKILDSLKTKNN